MLQKCRWCPATYAIPSVEAGVSYVCSRCTSPVIGTPGGRVVVVYGRRARDPEGALPAAIGRYRVTEELGRGGMGVVYLGEDPQLGRRVAIKVLLAGGFAGRDAVARLEREGRAGARLRHPGVARVLELGESDGIPFLALDLVDGPSLREVIDYERPLPSTECLRLVAEVADALAEAHDLGLVHRDVKPENVLVEVTGRPVLTDFGLVRESRDTSGLTSTGAVLGTPMYMAPEQARGDSHDPDPRADIYGLGSVLYTLLARRPPYVGANVQNVLVQVLSGPPTPLEQVVPHLPPAVAQVVRIAMARRPEDRYPNARELAADLRRCLEGQAPKGRHVSLRTRARRVLTARGVRLGTSAGAAVAVLVLSGAGVLWRDQRARAAHEAAWSERFRDVDARAESLRAGGREADAVALFDDLVSIRELQGTSTLARIWRRRAEVEPDQEVAWWARAYEEAPTLELQREAVIGLAGAFARRGQRRSLSGALRAAAELGASPAELGSLVVGEALLSRDATLGRPAADTAATRAALAALDGARLLPTKASRVHPTDCDGDGRTDLLLVHEGWLRCASTGDRLGQVLREVALPEGEARLVVVDGGPRPTLARTPSDVASTALYRWEGDELVRVLALPDALILTGTSADVDGDGQREMWIGTGPWQRDLLQVIPSETAPWTAVPTGVVQDLRSSVEDLDWVELDGDASPELVVVLGPWQHYELRAYDPGTPAADGLLPLTPLARLRTGHLRDITASGPTLIGLKDDAYESREVFGAETPEGPTRGVYRFGTEGGGLRSDHQDLAFPRVAGAMDLAVQRVTQVDLDGDGVAELLISLELKKEVFTLVAGQEASGSWSTALLGGLRIQAAHDLDGDGALEVVASLAEDDRLVVIGHDRAEGLPRPPVLPAPAVADLARQPPPTADPVLAEAWARAERLASMGLAADAAAALERTAALGDAGFRGPADLRAAALWEAAGLDERASAAFERAASTGSAEGWAGAARIHARAHRYPEARDAFARAGLSDTEVQGALAEVLGGPFVAWRFDGPPNGDWVVHDPGAARWDAANGGVYLTLSAQGGPAASVPLACVGGSARIDVELSMLRGDWASGLRFSLVPEGGGPAVADLTTTVNGGGGLLHRQATCGVPGTDPSAYHPRVHGATQAWVEPTEVRLALAVAPGIAPSLCVLDLGLGAVRQEQPTAPLPPGPYDLVVEPAPSGGLRDPFVLEALLRGVSVRGCSPRPVEPTPEVAAGEAWWSGDLAEAGRRYERVPGELGWYGHLVAAVDAGAHATVRSLVAARPPGSEERLAAILRTRPQVWSDLRAAMDARESWALVLASWWSTALCCSADPSVSRDLSVLLDAVSEASVDTLGGPDAAGRLELMHGRASMATGRPAAARLALTRAIGLLEGRADRAIDLREARQQLALAHVVLGDREGALAVLETWLEADPEAMEVLDRPGLAPELAALAAEAARRP